MTDAPSAQRPRLWTLQQAGGPVIATAIHDGHDLDPHISAAMALSDADRLREEDPFTGQAVTDVADHLVVHRSRFEFDLNRGPSDAVYATPDQSWGLEVWHGGALSPSLQRRSLSLHADYYRLLGSTLDSMLARHPRIVLIDVHSYNHRREGPNGPPSDPAKAPDINIGTSSMPRDHWAFLLDPLMEDMARFDFNGRRLDVRENVAFQGKGEQTRFVHQRYPGRACAIALEFKKFFMDEWTGEPDPAELAAMRAFIAHIAERAAAMLDR